MSYPTTGRVAGAIRIISKTGTPEEECSAAELSGGVVRITAQNALVATRHAAAKRTRVRFDGIVMACLPVGYSRTTDNLHGQRTFECATSHTACELSHALQLGTRRRVVVAAGASPKPTTKLATSCKRASAGLGDEQKRNKIFSHCSVASR